PELLKLLSLRKQRCWRLLPVTYEGELVMVAGARVWSGGWSDALAIRDRGDAKAFRCDPAGGEVWGREGGLAEVLDFLMELPAPSAPHAPVLVRARAPRLWLPPLTTNL
ncbi:hypothetical protein, partial [Actinophytocola sediminis]